MRVSFSVNEGEAQPDVVVKENLTNTQLHQNTWYDKRVWLWEFKMGDLVLIGSTTNDCQQTTCSMAGALSSSPVVTYLIDMQDKKKRTRYLSCEYAEGLPHNIQVQKIKEGISLRRSRRRNLRSFMAGR